MAAYGQGWPAIRDALEARLGALTFKPRVHDYVRFHRDSPLSSEHKAVFYVNGRYGQARYGQSRWGGDYLDLWMIHREGMPADNPSPDDETKTIRRHTVQLLGFLVHDDATASEKAWIARLDELATDLASGDATLGTTCLTYSNPTYSEAGVVGLWAGSVTAHTVTVSFQIEEVL